MTVFALIRPDDWNLPLFIHVLGALVLVGTLFTAAGFLLAGRGSVAAAQAGFKTLLYAALPAWLVMRIAAQWIESKWEFGDSEPAWVGIGYATSEGGLLLLIIATVVAGRALKRSSEAEPPPRGVSVAAYLVAFLIVVYLLTIWAMAAKPS